MTKEENLTIYDFINESYKITKPIRLIELFGGIGSQAKALENLGADFEHYRLIEFDKYPVASYNAVHGTNFEPKDITKTTTEDLGIVDTKNYEYLLTYSFPCQDLSIAGKQRGMQKGGGTRSGLLWEVERLIDECQELPQVLLMENVPQVIGKKNIDDFQRWQDKLSQLGYKNYVQILNAKDYGIPQNRNRCFMVSILGNYNYTFPDPIPLKLRLKDMLEDNVDEKYYIKNSELITKENDSFKIKNATKQGYLNAYDGDGVDLSYPKSNARRGRVQPQSIQTITSSCNLCVVVQNKKQEYCNKLIKENKVKEFDVISHNYTNNRNLNWDKRGAETNNETPALTTRPDTLGVVVKNPLKNKTSYGWHFEQGVYDDTGITRSIKAGGGSGNIPKVITNYDDLCIRKLTPKECWRLMGFSDDDYEKAAKVNSNAQLYKQAGNSIVVPVLEAIFSQLIETKESTVQTTEETKGAGLYDWIKATTREQWEHYLKSLTIDQLLQLQELEKKIKESEGIKK